MQDTNVYFVVCKYNYYISFNKKKNGVNEKVFLDNCLLFDDIFIWSCYDWLVIILFVLANRDTYFVNYNWNAEI